MKRIHVLVAGMLVLAVAWHASGTPILEISPQETVVAPGTSAELEVRLADATHLSGFYVEMTIMPQAGATGTVSFLGASGDKNPRYCFYGVNDLFQAPASGSTSLAAGDQTNPASIEVSTTAGVNDLLAVVQVYASAGAAGSFDVTINRTVLELFDQYGNDIPAFSQTVIRGATIIVPEPAAVLLLASGAFLNPLRSRRTGSRHRRRG